MIFMLFYIFIKLKYEPLCLQKNLIENIIYKVNREDSYYIFNKLVSE